MASPRIPLHGIEAAAGGIPSLSAAYVGIGFVGVYYAYFGRMKQGDDPSIVRFTNVQDLLNAIDYTARDSLTVRCTVPPCHVCIIY
jgi:hypothetical protein